jgi:hypothetical protein
MDLEGCWNTLVYELWERRLQKCVRALARWGRQMHRRWERWRLRRQAAQQIRREQMEAVKDGLVEQALARAVLDRSSKELRQSLLSEVWEQHKEELREQALEQVREEQREADEARRERWQAQKAEERRALEREVAQTAEADKHREMAEERLEFEERRQRLIRQRHEWKVRATDAEAWIADHLKHLFPDGQQILLRDPEITTFRLHTVNLILSRVGLEVKSRATDTPRQVATEVGPARWEQRSRFRLTTITPGVIDEEDDEDPDTSAEVEASQDA